MARTGWKTALQKAGSKIVEGSSDEDLRSMFEAADAACPKRMDEFTTLEEVNIVDDKRVEFRYLVSDDGRRIASQYDKRAMKRAVIEHIKGNPMAVAIAERELSVEHIYEDSSGTHVLSFTINRAVLEGDLEPLGQEHSNPFDVTLVDGNGQQRFLEEPASSEETRPELPRKFMPTRRTKDNPAGVRENPFFNET